MKALVGAFNQEKALLGAFSVIVQPVVEPMEHYTALVNTTTNQNNQYLAFQVSRNSGQKWCAVFERIQDPAQS